MAKRFKIAGEYCEKCKFCTMTIEQKGRQKIYKINCSQKDKVLYYGEAMECEEKEVGN